MTPGFPARRFDLSVMRAQNAALMRLEESIDLAPELRNLIKIRVSQLNGCVFCLDMYWIDARAEGATEERLYSLDAWRESRRYNARERAALGLCEALTLLPAGGFTEAAWLEATGILGDDAIQVALETTAVNAWNRLMIASGAEPGHYEAAMQEAA